MTSYGNKVFIFCLLLVGFCTLSRAEEAAAGQQDNNSSNQDQNAAEKDIVAPSFPSDLSLPSMGSLATGATVAVGVAAVFFILAAAWPVLNVRACSLFGTCGADYNSYNSVGTPYNNDAYTYSAQPPYTSTSYQKRSVSSRRRRNLH